MKFSIGFFLLIVATLLLSIKQDVPSPFLEIYVTHHPVDMRSTDYYKNPMAGTVYYSRMGDWHANGFKQLPGARAKEIEILSLEYARDNNHVYYKDKRLPFLDPGTANIMASFETFSPYVKDHNGVYHLVDPVEGRFEAIQGADTESFDIEVPENGSDSTKFAKDKEHCYYDGRKIAGILPDKFEVEDAKHFSDGTYIYTLDAPAIDSKGGDIVADTLAKEAVPPEDKQDDAAGSSEEID